MKIKINRTSTNTWYEFGKEYEVFDEDKDYYHVVHDGNQSFVSKNHCKVIEEGMTAEVPGQPRKVFYGNPEKSKYHREIKPDVWIDVYDVLKAFEVTNQATGHAIKKLLAPGKRGVKSTDQDLQEAIQSITRARELEQC